MAYPGATATVGVAGGLHYGIRTPNIGAREDYWVISQLRIIGGTQAMDIGGTGWRVIGNEMQCPGANNQVGCFEMSGANQAKFYGNDVHNAGINPTSSKFYHAVYFSTDSNHVEHGAGTTSMTTSPAGRCSFTHRRCAALHAVRVVQDDINQI